MCVKICRIMALSRQGIKETRVSLYCALSTWIWIFLLNLCCVSTVYNLLPPSRCVFDFISVSLHFDWPPWICTLFNVVVCQWCLKSERQELNDIGLREHIKTQDNDRASKQEHQKNRVKKPNVKPQTRKPATTWKHKKTQCQVQLFSRVVIQTGFVVCVDLVYVWSSIGITKCV